LPKTQPDDFIEFCNFMIGDISSCLFDGLLALEEIKNYEELREDESVWFSLPEEERNQAESNFREKTNQARGMN
jgi:hypothetical protein